MKYKKKSKALRLFRSYYKKLHIFELLRKTIHLNSPKFHQSRTQNNNNRNSSVLSIRFLKLDQSHKKFPENSMVIFFL